jgi:hypothetical protein
VPPAVSGQFLKLSLNEFRNPELDHNGIAGALWAGQPVSRSYAEGYVGGDRNLVEMTQRSTPLDKFQRLLAPYQIASWFLHSGDSRV